MKLGRTLGWLGMFAVTLAGCSSSSDEPSGAVGGAAGSTGFGGGTGGTDGGDASSGGAGGASGGDADTTDASTDTAVASEGGDANAAETSVVADGGADGAETSVAADAGGCTGVLGHPAGDCSSYPKYPGFTLKIVEEFAEPLDLATDPIWTWSDGGLGEGAVRFLKQNIVFQDGKMVIVVKKESVPGSTSFAEGTANNYPNTLQAYPLSSGEVRTKYNNYRYGKYEFRYKPPKTGSVSAANPGNYCSASFVFRTPKWQEWREIDIEMTPDHKYEVGRNLIYGDKVIGWDKNIESFNYVPVPGLLDAGTDAGADAGTMETDFHTYGFVWLPDKVTWTIDGAELLTMPPFPARANPETWPQLQVPQMSAKILMNVWVFTSSGAFAGHYPADNVYPFQSEYEWVRFYQWDQETTYPCSPLPSCLPDADRDYSKNNPEDGIPATPSGK
jgi:beta-glucanase (GH16 family)